MNNVDKIQFWWLATKTSWSCSIDGNCGKVSEWYFDKIK